MLWSLPAGFIAGFVLAFFGAGGAVIALPFFLFLAGLAPHTALGTNALGVALITAALLACRIWQRDVPLIEGLLLTVPGIPGIYLGARLSLIYPGQRLVFILGVLLFVIAAWIAFLSTRSTSRGSRPSAESSRPVRRPGRIVTISIVAFAIGLAAGFFAVAGGFLIVPALIIAAGLPLAQAVAAALVPMSAYAAVIAFEYSSAGAVRLDWSAVMLAGGIAGGLFGIWLSKRLPKILMQRALAVFLALLGVYIVLR